MIASRYDKDIKEHAKKFFEKHKLQVEWECRENPGNTGENIHYHAIIKTNLKISTIRKYRTIDKEIPSGQENLTFTEITEYDQFLNYIHKGEFVEETGLGKNKKYLAHTKSHPFITKIPNTEPGENDTHNYFKMGPDNNLMRSDNFYHNRFWDIMENLKRVIKIQTDKDGTNTVHKKGTTDNEDFIKFMRKFLCYKTVKGNISLIENIKMEDITEKIIDYYRLYKKDFDEIVIKKKTHLFYATVVRDTDPITYKQWVKSKADMLINAGFIPPKCRKDEVEKYKIRDDTKDYLEE